MGMSIDEATLYMELYKRKLFNSVSDLDKDIEAYDTAIDTMRKYQKIEQIVKNTQQLCSYGSAFIDIREVVEDGKN